MFTGPFSFKSVVKFTSHRMSYPGVDEPAEQFMWFQIPSPHTTSGEGNGKM